MNKNYNYPVYGIPPSFINDKLEFDTLEYYLEYLYKEGANCIMTTAGTSQFNLLSNKEILKFNTKCSKFFKGEKILGLKEGSLSQIKNQLDKHDDRIDFNDLDNIAMLVLFPDRYYNTQQLIKYFYSIAEHSKFPILIHCNSIRKGNSGTFEYSAEVMNELAIHPKIIGMKEESSTWDLGYNLCRDIKNKHEDFNIIVAGGSQKRFLSLRNGGANSFLSGIGNILPSIEENFYAACLSNDQEEIKKCIGLEKILFDTFMTIGWHASLRFALSHIGFLKENRNPFVELQTSEKSEIIKTLKKIKL